MTDVRRQKTADGAELLVSLRLAREGGGDAKQIGPGPVRDRWGAVRGDGRDGRRPRPSSRTIASRSKRARARLGPGLDSGGRQPGRQRLLVCLRAAGPRGARSSSPRTRRRRGRWSWPRRSRPTRRSSARPKWSRPINSRRSTGTRSRSSCGRPRCPRRTRPRQVQAFVDRGGAAIFFPPRSPRAGELFGVRWTSWVEDKAESAGRELAGR